MREIKFRGKRIDNGQWVYGQYFKTPLTDENSGTTPDAGWFFLCGEPRHCIVQDGVSFVIDVETLGQFAGLHDKNGKEIYEGDVIKRKSMNTEQTYYYEIKWIEEKARLMAEGGTCLESISSALERGYILADNIYDNPELIKELTPAK